MSEWVKGKPRSSFHLVSTWTRVPARALTLCGRVVETTSVLTVLPAGQRSCESCLRLMQWLPEA